MNRLLLYQELHRRTGIGGGNPSTTVGLANEAQVILDYLDYAYEDIQNTHTTWDFLRSDFSFNTVSGTQDYAPTTSPVSLTLFKHWITQSFRVYLAATGVSDEQWLEYVPWRQFRDAFQLASQRTQTGRPVQFTIKPDDSLAFWPTPDDTYTIVGEYYKKPDVMTADADEPLWQDGLHRVVVWRAVMFYALEYAEPDKYAVGKDEYKKMLRNLEQVELPRMGFGEPLA